MEYRIISIGTLSTHELWDEPPATRTAHATTTLIKSGPHTILVDPGLPPQVIAARLNERAGIKPTEVTDVFLTTFRPAHRWGLPAFEHARWLISETEREAVGQHLVQRYRDVDDPEVQKILEHDIAILKKCAPAPDKLAPQVDLFPLPGYSPGTCGLLLPEATTTTLIASDAVATNEHLQQGRVLQGCIDPNQSRESFLEAIEIADLIIPGHDNIIPNPTRRPM